MNKDEFSLYHWEFYVDHVAPDDNDIIYVYETRTCNVIGTLQYCSSLDSIKDILSVRTEDEVNDWIENNIEYI